ncbi:MAG: lactate utilization protein [Candidatus Aminicenantes bacterium]|nr:lactate utilization protein [Candidatus Aminicenantes bacterium]
MDPIKETFKNQAEQIIKSLKKRNINGVYYENGREAVEAVCKLIPDGALVGLGGSMTIIETGLIDALRKMNIRLLDRYKEGVTPERINEMRRESLLSDVFIASSNAITSDGKLVNQDGVGNRVAAMIYGPKKVILMVGMNKVVRSVEDGIARIKTTAGPINAVRVQVDTPCSKLGFCSDPNCHPPYRICNQLVVTESSSDPERITVVLIGESLGY